MWGSPESGERRCSECSRDAQHLRPSTVRRERCHRPESLGEVPGLNRACCLGSRAGGRHQSGGRPFRFGSIVRGVGDRFVTSAIRPFGVHEATAKAFLKLLKGIERRRHARGPATSFCTTRPAFAPRPQNASCAGGVPSRSAGTGVGSDCWSARAFGRLSAPIIGKGSTLSPSIRWGTPQFREANDLTRWSSPTHALQVARPADRPPLVGPP